jgi:hypothetical protein
VADLLESLGERLKALAGEWSKFTVLGSFLLYVTGYLALRFHLTAIGVGTDLSVLDERYLFTGARFVVYLVSAVPNVIIIAFPLALIVWAARKAVSESTRARFSAWLMEPARLAVLGIVFSVVMIQFVMRQCFVLSNLLLARKLPPEPAWLVGLVLDDRFMPVYFSLLVAACAVPLAILAALRGRRPQGGSRFATGLLVFLAAVQVLMLPINYGILIVDKALPRVAALGDKPLADGEEAWLVWEGKEGVTFLVRNQDQKSLVTLPRSEVKRTEILGFDRILPRLFGSQPGGNKR